MEKNRNSSINGHDPMKTLTRAGFQMEVSEEMDWEKAKTPEGRRQEKIRIAKEFLESHPGWTIEGIEDLETM